MQSRDAVRLADRTLGMKSHAAHLTLAGVVILISLAGLARTWSYYGTIMRGLDGQYYYALTASVLFDRDLDITNNLAHSPYTGPFDHDHDGSFEAVDHLPDGRIRNKYPVGLVGFELPWMAIGRGVDATAGRLGWVTPITSKSRYGWSNIEIAMVAFGLVCYVALAMALMSGWCAGVTGARPWVCALLGLACFAGTSTMYYTAALPFMSHGVALLLVVVALIITGRLRVGDTPRLGMMCLLGLVCGLIFLVRPQMVLIAGLLGLALIGPLWRNVKARWQLAPPITVMLAVVAIQLVYNGMHLGAWGLSGYSSGGEHFNWTSPDFFAVLAHPARGLLWMTPIVWLAALGLMLGRMRSWADWVVLGHGVVQVYVIASWSEPMQGDSFGPRMWIACLPMVLLGLARAWVVLGKVHVAGRIAFGVAVGCCSLWTSLLMLAYANGSLQVAHGYVGVARVALGVLQ